MKSSDQNITANGLYFSHHSPFTSGIMAIHKSRHANGIQSHKDTFVSSAASATIGQILILIIQASVKKPVPHTEQVILILNYLCTSKDEFFISLLMWSTHVILVSPLIACFITEEATAKLTVSSGVILSIRA